MVAKSILANMEVTERSRKFYDGTYQVFAEGFVDDKGLYRDFDCIIPEARAPTPLPPTFPDDSEDESVCEEKGVHSAAEDLPTTEHGRKVSKEETSPVTQKETGNQSEVVSSPSSDLSDCSSELLNWKMDKGLMKTSALAREGAPLPAAKHAPKRTTTTRGVAQKVRRTQKRASAVTATKKAPAAAPSTRNMTPDEGGMSRRRSARLR
ncbi:hypothetical protein FB567DRAFT_22596 [Paraphoma chrysanthemicola]|uniref:Uncharacterized protein n=1 Tax=Paraphoma chrysanthemicola TaxID=798071 RepID=A0A8K0RKU9_9PLEO|nr:hypothetical protein FB567DRAFT_22596 [Paraphoma chrysanthemicola]